MDQQRPKGRERQVTGTAKDIHKTGQGLGTGPVGSASGHAGRPGGSMQAGSGSGGNSGGNSGGSMQSGGSGPRRSGGGMGPLILIVIIGIVLLGGGGGLFGLFLLWKLLPRYALTGYLALVYLSEIFNFTLSAFRLRRVLPHGAPSGDRRPCGGSAKCAYKGAS